ncbi:hypothetical protein TIFTF001_026653 [Ficus carica]|uniref:Uncharacterized protein n=1 Tax=Ficus carica TaxID=3494 RepID=A0AA88DLK7_FICCA|nr:hypothetical protein TIFTF001_026653 [Ficus carica]
MQKLGLESNQISPLPIPILVTNLPTAAIAVPAVISRHYAREPNRRGKTQATIKPHRQKIRQLGTTFGGKSEKRRRRKGNPHRCRRSRVEGSTVRSRP